MMQNIPVVEKKMDFAFCGMIQLKLKNDRKLLKIQIDVIKATTLLWVTSSWYRRWKWIAKNLSAAKATTPRKEAQEKRFLVVRNMCFIILYVWVWVSSPIIITRRTMYKGWTIKPTPRSEADRLRSNAFKVIGNDGVFLSAWIVAMFNMAQV